jgi:hypothetical protein
MSETRASRRKEDDDELVLGGGAYGVSVAGTGNVLRRTAVGHEKRGLGNHLTHHLHHPGKERRYEQEWDGRNDRREGSYRADHVHAEDLVGLGVGEVLHEALIIVCNHVNGRLVSTDKVSRV